MRWFTIQTCSWTGSPLRFGESRGMARAFDPFVGNLEVILVLWPLSGPEVAIPDAAPGYTGMLLGMEESYKKGESESILVPRLAASIVRCWLKRRRGIGGPGRLSFEKR